MRSLLTCVVALGLVACSSAGKEGDDTAAADGASEGSDGDDGSDGSDGGESTAETDLYQGVWLLRVPWADPSDAGCSEGFDHNFPGAYRPDDGPWTESETADRSDALYFVQIERVGESEAVMLIGRDILLGTGSGDSWTFAWTESDDTLSLEEHEDGYVYREEATVTNTVSLALSFDGTAASGTWDGATDQLRHWEESDEWVESVGRASGVIPVADWLVYDEAGSEGIPEANLRTEADCDGARCELSWTQSCSGSSPVTLGRTSYEDEDVYDLLEEVSQPFGSGL